MNATVIIGGGQARLAIGYFLVQQNRDFVIRVGRDAAYLARQLTAGGRSPEHRGETERESQWA